MQYGNECLGGVASECGMSYYIAHYSICDIKLHCSSASCMYPCEYIVLSREWKMKAIGGPKLTESFSNLLLLYKISWSETSQLLFNWYSLISGISGYISMQHEAESKFNHQTFLICKCN